MAWRWLNNYLDGHNQPVKLFVPKDEILQSIDWYSSHTIEYDTDWVTRNVLEDFSQIGEITNYVKDLYEAARDDGVLGSMSFDFKNGAIYLIKSVSYSSNIVTTRSHFKKANGSGGYSYLTNAHNRIDGEYWSADATYGYIDDRDYYKYPYYYGYAIAINEDDGEAILCEVLYQEQLFDDEWKYYYRIYGSAFYFYDLTDPGSPVSGYHQGAKNIYNFLMLEEAPEPTPSDPDTFTFYNHSKKVNSTKQPTGGTEIRGYFRDAYNLLNPTIIIEAENEFPYNYVSWYDSANDLRRYYWIQNKAWMRNKLIEITLEEDMLATFKTSIGNMNAFVVRSASNFNSLITDTAWSTKNGVDLANATPVNQPFDVANGFYVVAIANPDNIWNEHNEFAKIGGIKYYAATETAMSRLIEWLNTTGNTGEWADYNPLSRIISVKFIPFKIEWEEPLVTLGDRVYLFDHTYQEGGQTVRAYGTWDLGVLGVVPSNIVSGSGYVGFSDHPDASTDKAYLNYLPYTEFELKAGPFGKIDLSKNMLDKDSNVNQFDFTVTVDLISGLSKLHIYNGQNLIYYTEDYSCTVDIALTQETFNKYSDILQRDFNKKQAVLQTASQAASAGGALVGAATFQNPLLLASGVALMANAIATQERGKDQYIIDSYNMSIPQLSCRGTNGTWMKISENWRLITTYHRIAGDGGAILGRPKNDTVRISTCSGYLICNAASFEDSNAILTEIISINEYLNKGFYYE